MPLSDDLVAVLVDVKKSYQMDAVEVPVLKCINLHVRAGNFTVLMGPSGSGKTTLLNVLGCIDQPDIGQVIVAGQDISKLTDDALTDFRAKNIGFIFQNFNLLPVLNAFENVEYPMLIGRVAKKVRHERTLALLDAVGLSDRAKNLPGQLSGGQRQRVAIARALAMQPRLVVADEPTANLDSQTGAEILRVMRTIQQEHRVSFLFSSHDPSVMKAADDLIMLKDGLIQSRYRKRTETEKQERLAARALARSSATPSEAPLPI